MVLAAKGPSGRAFVDNASRFIIGNVCGAHGLNRCDRSELVGNIPDAGAQHSQNIIACGREAGVTRGDCRACGICNARSMRLIRGSRTVWLLLRYGGLQSTSRLQRLWALLRQRRLPGRRRLLRTRFSTFSSVCRSSQRTCTGAGAEPLPTDA